MAYNSFKTRKALGRRYGTDPALQMEMERLQQEYNLMPGREARGLQASQFDRELAFKNEQAQSTEKGAMASSLMNAGMTGLSLYKLGGGELGSIYPAIKSGAKSAYQGVQGMFGGAPAAAPTVVPAMIDTAAAGIGAGEMAGGIGGTALTSGAGEAAGGIAGGTSASAGASGGAGAVAGPVAAIIGAAELAKGKWGQLDKGWDEKSYMGKATSAPGSLIGAGGIVTNLAKEGTVVSNIGREIARLEQQLMQPIDKLLGIDNSSIKWVLCSELVRQGKLKKEIVDEEWEYVRQIITAEEYCGYRIISDPLVKLMQKSKIFTLIMTPFIKSFAYEMASRVNSEIKGNLFGKIILLIGLPVCSLVAQKEVYDGNVG